MIKFPRPLQPGDRIAILSPASIVEAGYIDGALKVLEACGWQPYVTPHALGQHGSYSGTVQQRLDDFSLALSDPATRAILCSRGGYGAVHLLDRIPIDLLRDDPRWIIGYSDISALHALMSVNGIASLHAPMAKHLTLNGGNDCCSQHLFSILRGDLPHYSIPSDPRSVCGQAVGQLIGGNLAVLQALISTSYDILSLHDTILFVEDIAEPIYKVERIFHQLRLNGTLQHIRAIILGQFTQYRADRNHTDIYSAIVPLVSNLGIPVAVNFPIGHVDDNRPLIISANASLSISLTTTSLNFNLQ